MSTKMNLVFTDGTSTTVAVTIADMIRAEDALALRGKNAQTHPLQAGITGAYFACKRADSNIAAFNEWLDTVEKAETTDEDGDSDAAPFL